MNERELDVGLLQPVPLSAQGPLRMMHEKKKVTVWVSSFNENCYSVNVFEEKVTVWVSSSN